MARSVENSGWCYHNAQAALSAGHCNAVCQAPGILVVESHRQGLVQMGLAPYCQGGFAYTMISSGEITAEVGDASSTQLGTVQTSSMGHQSRLCLAGTRIIGTLEYGDCTAAACTALTWGLAAAM
jgi:hypothetical protein